MISRCILPNTVAFPRQEILEILCVFNHVARYVHSRFAPVSFENSRLVLEPPPDWSELENKDLRYQFQLHDKVSIRVRFG